MKLFKPVKTAVIGCGMISETYLKNIVEYFQVLDVVGCADLVRERAQAKAEKYGINSPLWIVYDIATGSLAGVLDELVTEIS